MNRGKLDVEDLLKIVLALLVVYLVIKVLDATLSLLGGIVGLLLDPVVALIVIVLIVLWYTDRI